VLGLAKHASVKGDLRVAGGPGTRYGRKVDRLLMQAEGRAQV